MVLLLNILARLVSERAPRCPVLFARSVGHHHGAVTSRTHHARPESSHTPVTYRVCDPGHTCRSRSGPYWPVAARGRPDRCRSAAVTDTTCLCRAGKLRLCMTLSRCDLPGRKVRCAEIAVR